MGEVEVPWSQYDKAYQAIHSALSQIAVPPPGKRVTKLGFTWSPEGTLSSLKVYDGAELLFTLSFSWNPDGTLKEVARSDA